MDLKQPEFRFKAITLILLVISLLSIYLLNPSFYPKLWYLLTSGDIKAIVEILRSYGAWAALVSILLNVLINALGFLPSIFLSTANGVLFGVVPGIFISWLAECIGVIVSFLLMRSFLRQCAEMLIEKHNYLKKVDEFSGENGFKMMLFARSLPYFPSGVITALGAVSRISIKDYILATAIGKFPSTALEVIIGHDIVNYEKNMARLSILIAAVLLVYLGFWWKKKTARVKSEE